MLLSEITENLITMWHGGRNLQLSYREVYGNKSKQMEYGPGLYLTIFILLLLNMQKVEVKLT